MKDPFKKLYGNIKSCGFEVDEKGKLLSIASGAPGSSSHRIIFDRMKNGETIYYDDIKDDHKVKLVKLTIDDLKRKWKAQTHRCYWLDIPLDPKWIFEPSHPGSLSCDRLDEDEHYTYDNIVITCRFANLGRGLSHVRQFSEWLHYLKGTLTDTGVGIDRIMRNAKHV